MGKSTTPTKWFKAVKKAFRSPSKERPSPTNKQGDADEKLLNKQDFPPVTYAAPTPHPLPSFEGVTHNKSQQQSHGSPDQAGTDPAMTDKKTEVEEPEQQQHSRNGNINGVEKHQEEGGDSTLSKEDEAAIRIQQRFLRNPKAMKGLIRLQALVRGQLVRRQATTTLRTMEAIVRVQALFRGRRVRMSKDGRAVKTQTSRIQRLSSRVRKDARSKKFQEMEAETREAEHEVNKRKRRTAYLLTQQLKRSTPNRSSSFIDCDPEQPHEGWAWLELWTNAKAWESRQLEAATHESKLDPKDYIEIIPGSSRRTSDYPTVKEVDFRTLNKLKYHENGNGTSNSNPLSKAFEISDAGFSSKKSTSPHLTTPSPAASEDAAIARIDLVPVSPNPSETSVKLDAADGDLSLAMEQLVFPEVANGSTTPSDSFSTSNGELKTQRMVKLQSARLRMTKSQRMVSMKTETAPNPERMLRVRGPASGRRAATWLLRRLRRPSSDRPATPRRRDPQRPRHQKRQQQLLLLNSETPLEVVRREWSARQQHSPPARRRSRSAREKPRIEGVLVQRQEVPKRSLVVWMLAMMESHLLARILWVVEMTNVGEPKLYATFIRLFVAISSL